jgi:hypothetical protein
MAENITLDILTRTQKAASNIEKFSKDATKDLKSIEKQTSFLQKAFSSFAGNIAANLTTIGFTEVRPGRA